MWDETAEENGVLVLVAFKRLFYTKFAGLASSVTQMVEVGVKKIGHYTTTGRLGEMRSCYYGIAANSYEHITSSGQEVVDSERKTIRANRSCVQPLQISHQAKKMVEKSTR
jgi:hypothetical protein